LALLGKARRDEIRSRRVAFFIVLRGENNSRNFRMLAGYPAGVVFSRVVEFIFHR